MKKDGITLTELLISIILLGIMILATTCLFVAEQSMRYAVRDQINAIEEANIAIDHISKTLRFAKTSILIKIENDTPNYKKSVTATIAGGYIPGITVQTQVVYGWRINGNPNDNTLECVIGTNAPVVVSRDITDFDADWSDKVFLIKLTATRKNASSPLETKIWALLD